ncbi:MAG: hypothetical protein AAGJ38_01910 [Planctomycetota bacterium]
MSETLMSKPVLVLIVLAVLAAGLYLYRGCAGGPTLAVRVTSGPDGPTFMFNGRVGLEELIVTADPDGEARVVWHLVPRVDDDGNEEEPRPNMAITYGRRWGLGMRAAPDTPRNGEPLEPGVTYEFFADTTAGKARTRFTVPDA